MGKGKGDNQDHICRNCHEAGGDLIKPCGCQDENLRWVHRDCLNTWRSVSPDPSSFSHCDICHQAYYMRRKKLGPGPYVKMIFGMIRDIFLVLLVVTILIVVPGSVIYAIEHFGHVVEAFVSDSAFIDVFSNPAFDIFALGAAFDCFIIGLIGIGYGVCKCVGFTCKACCCIPIGEEAHTYYTYSSYNYRSTIPAWWWWYIFLSPPRGLHPCCCCCCADDCCRIGCIGCGECCSGCIRSCEGRGKGCDFGNLGNAALIVVLIIVLIIILIGFIIGIVLLTIITVRIIVNHVTILQKQKEAQELEVVDLSQGLAKDDPSIIVLSDDNAFVSPYANASAGAYVPPSTGYKEQSPLLSGPQPQVMIVGTGPTAPPPEAYAPPPEAYAPMPQAFVPADPNGYAQPSVPADPNGYAQPTAPVVDPNMPVENRSTLVDPNVPPEERRLE